MQDSEALAATYLAQAQAALLQIDNLKDLLAESAAWYPDSSPLGPAHVGAPQSPTQHTHTEQGPADSRDPGLRHDERAGGVHPASHAGDEAAEGAQGGSEGHAGGAGQDAAAEGGRQGGRTDEPGGGGAGCGACAAMQRHALQQSAQAAELDLQLKAMKLEILRSAQLAGQMGRSMLPALYSIESRLLLDLPA